MERACDSCGEVYEAKTSRSRFCSDLCRVRASRGAEPAGDSDGPVARATRSELSELGRTGSALGCAALSLAARLDSGRGTDSGLAALNREWRTTLDAALAAVEVASPVSSMRDELAARRRGA